MMTIAQIIADCEKRFQAGAPRVQVRNADGSFARGSDRSAQRAREQAMPDQTVWKRVKCKTAYRWKYESNGVAATGQD